MDMATAKLIEENQELLEMSHQQVQRKLEDIRIFAAKEGMVKNHTIERDLWAIEGFSVLGVAYLKHEAYGVVFVRATEAIREQFDGGNFRYAVLKLIAAPAEKLTRAAVVPNTDLWPFGDPAHFELELVGQVAANHQFTNAVQLLDSVVNDYNSTRLMEDYEHYELPKILQHILI